jgi:hypothetical protein
VTGGSGAIPFNHARQPAYSNDGFTITSRGVDEQASRTQDGRFGRPQQFSTGIQERVVSEADIPKPQSGKMRRRSVRDLHDVTLPSKQISQHGVGNHVKLKPPLDLTSGNPQLGRNHGH